jgi:hypothetical protein
MKRQSYHHCRGSFWLVGTTLLKAFKLTRKGVYADCAVSQARLPSVGGIGLRLLRSLASSFNPHQSLDSSATPIISADSTVACGPLLSLNRRAAIQTPLPLLSVTLFEICIDGQCGSTATPYSCGTLVFRFSADRHFPFLSYTAKSG